MTRRKGDKIAGGKADSKKPSDFSKKNLKKGQKVEREHTSNKAIAKEIAMDHLTEDSKYYQKLAKMEGKKMEKEKKGEAEHLEHPQMEKKMPDCGELTNDCAPHLHHPQIPASKGHVEPLFDPKKGFKKPSEIV